MKSTLTALSLSLIVSSVSHASAGLTINAAEIGVGKFHRMDNTVHPYGADNAWLPYVLDQGEVKTPIVKTNANGSITIFFSTLDELLGQIEKVSAKQKISVLNIHGHGLPGAMWFPKDDSALQSADCADWRQAASAKDDLNYAQYYSPVPKNEIDEIKMVSNYDIQSPCTTGLPEWKEIAAKHAGLKSLFNDDVQVHFLSCVVGLGTSGDSFTKGIASLLLTSNAGRVQTSMKFGLGDWSMVEGMGFWDYISDAQLDKDNTDYPVNKVDRAEMQSGSIRIAGRLNQVVQSTLLSDQQFMFLDDRNPGVLTSSSSEESAHFSDAPRALNVSNLHSIRIIGTAYKVPLAHYQELNFIPAPRNKTPKMISI